MREREERNGAGCGMRHGRSLRFAACVFVVLPVFLVANVGQAQDIHPVASGQVSGVKMGITQTVRAGTIARGPGGERAGAGGFASTEGPGRVVSGRVAGYGARQTLGSLSEYSPTRPASFGGSPAFPDTDFVAGMPKPSFQGSTFSAAAASGMGVTLTSGYGGSRVGRSSGTHHTGHALKDPDAILNPFTHVIGPSLSAGLPGVGSGRATVLGRTP